MISLKFSPPRHPQGNKQAQASNKTILSTSNKQLEKANGRWAEELPEHLWAYRTTARAPKGSTPSPIVYIAEVVLPIEISVK